jgi:hypothetical protein
VYDVKIEGAQCRQDMVHNHEDQKSKWRTTHQHTKHCAPRPTSLCIIPKHHDSTTNTTRSSSHPRSTTRTRFFWTTALYPPNHIYSQINSRHRLAQIPTMSSPSPLDSGAAQHIPTMALSPFAFENNLNIGFRKILEGQSYPEFSKCDNDATRISASSNHQETSCNQIGAMSPPSQYDMETLTAFTTHVSALSSHYETSCDGNGSISPPQCDIDTPAASTPNTPSASTPSTRGMDSSSNASQSPTPSSSVDFTFTPSRSSSPTMPPPLNSYSCSKCNETFRLLGELNKHWNRKHEKRFSCTAQGCDKAFNLKADLNRHIKSKHEVRTEIPCEYVGCLESFSRKDNMRRHMKEEHEHSKRRRAGSG